jgi:hypothetical protein
MTNQEFLPARGAPKNTIAEQLDPQRRAAAIIDVTREALDELARESFEIRRWPAKTRWYHRWVVQLADRWAPVIAGQRMRSIADAALDEVSEMTSQDWRDMKRVTPVRPPWSPYLRKLGRPGPRLMHELIVPATSRSVRQP